MHVVPAPQEDSLGPTDTSQRCPEFRPRYLPWRDALEGLQRSLKTLGQVSAALGGSPSKASLSRYLSGKQQPSYETEVAICREYLALEADPGVDGGTDCSPAKGEG